MLRFFKKLTGIHPGDFTMNLRSCCDGCELSLRTNEITQQARAKRERDQHSAAQNPPSGDRQNNVGLVLFICPFRRPHIFWKPGLALSVKAT